jgi:signal transduction histidine kinase
VEVNRLIWAVAWSAALASVIALGFAASATPVPTGAIVYLVSGPIPFLAAGMFLLWRRSEDRIGRLLVLGTAGTMSYAALLERLILDAGTEAHSWLSGALFAEALLSSCGLVALALVIALYPTGEPRGRTETRFARSLWAMPGLMLLALLANRRVLVDPVAYAGADPFPNPLHVPALSPLGPVTAGVRPLLGVALVASLVMLVMRYRKEIDLRRQIRWVLFGAGAALTLGILPYVLWPLFDPAGMTHAGLAQILGTIGLFLLPAAIVIGVEQPSWIDTDAVIRRSIAYGTLSIGIFALYAVIAAGAGVAVGSRLPLEVAIAVTLAVAAVFHPARIRLQGLADRLVFGPRPTPIEAVAGLDETLEASDTDLEVAPRLADLVRRAVRLRWVEVEIPPHIPYRAGSSSGDAVAVVGIQRGEEIYGSIRCGPKATGTFSTEDRNLVGALAAQTALLVTNLRLAGRIVHAQEAERRRIERNLHDGAQQELVALVAKLGLARARAKTEHIDESTFIELQSDAQSILRDLRDLAQGIHPSVLTDGGLIEAVEDRCSRLPIDVKVDSNPELRSRRFPDEVESAAYFFVAEGMTNVLKHSAATEATVEVRSSNGHLELSVSDDGSGFDPGSVRSSGLAGLSDRFEALSGSVSFATAPGAGTVLKARLPIP